MQVLLTVGDGFWYLFINIVYFFAVYLLTNLSELSFVLRERSYLNVGNSLCFSALCYSDIINSMCVSWDQLIQGLHSRRFLHRKAYGVTKIGVDGKKNSKSKVKNNTFLAGDIYTYRWFNWLTPYFLQLQNVMFVLWNEFGAVPIIFLELIYQGPGYVPPLSQC